MRGAKDKKKERTSKMAAYLTQVIEQSGGVVLVKQDIQDNIDELEYLKVEQPEKRDYFQGQIDILHKVMTNTLDKFEEAEEHGPGEQEAK
ncbi:MAG: hypothetical protein A4E31_01143 [Methanomassiliicoccales archaeon PtaU1.Bin030]|jgi:hypothetical protein|nr:MAG: hypothetical protein A4E31_01143 [Methanomassiliicoccales archaeon PtaU1.Bin030]